jgi:hypothetical protein
MAFPLEILVTKYSLFGDSENRGKNYLKIRDLLSIVLFNILGAHYSKHICPYKGLM